MSATLTIQTKRCNECGVTKPLKDNPAIVTAAADYLLDHRTER
jgi:hypothetical protein